MNLVLHGDRREQVMKYSWDLMRHGGNRKHGNEIQLGFNARSFRVTVLDLIGNVIINYFYLVLVIGNNYEELPVISNYQ